MRHFYYILLCAMLSPLASWGAPSVMQNVYARKATTLNGKWDIIIDPYDAGYYNYRMQPNADGFFLNRKPDGKSDHVEYDFVNWDALTVPRDWNSQRTELFYYEGTIWYKKDFK